MNVFYCEWIDGALRHNINIDHFQWLFQLIVQIVNTLSDLAEKIARDSVYKDKIPKLETKVCPHLLFNENLK